MVDNSDDSSQRKIQVFKFNLYYNLQCNSKGPFQLKMKILGKTFSVQKRFLPVWTLEPSLSAETKLSRSILDPEMIQLDPKIIQLDPEMIQLDPEYDLRDQLWKQTKKYLSLNVDRFSENETWKHNSDARARHDAISTKNKDCMTPHESVNL
jgi:hypothetical protein